MSGMVSRMAEIDDPRERREDALTTRIAATMRRKLAKDYPPAGTRRDAHPKHTGLLEGVFTVDPALPADLRVGLFAEARSYQAWVRTSSASDKPQSDAVRDVRGLAIKLLDVPGEKIPESDEPQTQDFLLLSHPSMPLGTVRLFHDAIVYAARYSPLVFAAKMLLTGRSGVLKELDAARIRPSSPLEIRYWSTTPYRFGADRVVKYSLLPTPGETSVNWIPGCVSCTSPAGASASSSRCSSARRACRSTMQLPAGTRRSHRSSLSRRSPSRRRTSVPRSATGSPRSCVSRRRTRLSSTGRWAR